MRPAPSLTTRPVGPRPAAQAKATPRFLRVFEAGRGALTAADAPRALEDVLGPSVVGAVLGPPDRTASNLSA